MLNPKRTHFLLNEGTYTTCLVSLNENGEAIIVDKSLKLSVFGIPICVFQTFILQFKEIISNYLFNPPIRLLN